MHHFRTSATLLLLLSLLFALAVAASHEGKLKTIDQNLGSSGLHVQSESSSRAYAARKDHEELLTSLSSASRTVKARSDDFSRLARKSQQYVPQSPPLVPLYP